MSGRVCEVEMPSRAECSVVVAVDGSPAAPAAARWAASKYNIEWKVPHISAQRPTKAPSFW
ncbi:hypothetical protein ACWEVD_28310, partial [Nocardia thailandica]